MTHARGAVRLGWAEENVNREGDASTTPCAQNARTTQPSTATLRRAIATTTKRPIACRSLAARMSTSQYHMTHPLFLSVEETRTTSDRPVTTRRREEEPQRPLCRSRLAVLDCTKAVAVLSKGWTTEAHPAVRGKKRKEHEGIC